MPTIITCPQCGRNVEKPNSEVNRARRELRNIYCGKECSGMARRSGRTDEKKKRKKAEYDKKYRAKNKEYRAKQKAEYFQKTYDPKAAAIHRKKIKLENPEIEARRRDYIKSKGYVERKKKYDRRYRAYKKYGEEWGECFALSLDIRDECLSRSSDYDIRLEKGTLNKRQNRRREYERTYSKEPEVCPLGNT